MFGDVVKAKIFKIHTFEQRRSWPCAAVNTREKEIANVTRRDIIFTLTYMLMHGQNEHKCV